MYQEAVISMALIRLELHGSWFPFAAVPWFFLKASVWIFLQNFLKNFKKNVDILIYSAIIAPILSELHKITDIPQ